jgi:hypothetical protein
MTAVAVPVTDAAVSGDEGRAVSAGVGMELQVALPDTGVAERRLVAEVAEAVVRLVEEMAPQARTRVLVTEGAGDPVSGAAPSPSAPVSTSESATRRAQEAWRSAPGRATVLIDADARRLTVDGVPVALTYKELALLEYLVRSSHRAVSREELLRTVWSTAASAEGTRTIDVHVRRLRKKLGGFVQIVTVRGVGYRCDPTPEVVLVGSGDAG